MKLDRYDRAIVRALQLDGRITNSQLAETVNLSESASLRRVRALEESGFIEGYTALINQQKAGCPVNVFVNITLERQEQAHLRAFEEAARKVPEVMECYLMSGEYDYLLRVVLADTADFERLHSQHLTRLPNVARVHSSFALRTRCKNRASCPFASLPTVRPTRAVPARAIASRQTRPWASAPARSLFSRRRPPTRCSSSRLARPRNPGA